MKLLYKGKAKSVYQRDPDTLVMEFRDDLTAGDGTRRETKAGKGAINAEISARLFQVLQDGGIESHFLSFEAPNRHIVQRVGIVPLEVICRNIAAGSLVRRYPFEEGQELAPPIVEMGYKSDKYHDPFLNEDIALALKLCTMDELAEMRGTTLRVNELLKAFLLERGIILVDFKVEFGRRDGKIILADEISPDTCRLWDAGTRQVMDKDRFRKDMGEVLEYYREVQRRVLG